jgi:hypothetical protein
MSGLVAQQYGIAVCATAEKRLYPKKYTYFVSPNPNNPADVFIRRRYTLPSLMVIM